MPAASNAIAPKGGYNHGSIYWLSPQTGTSTAGDIGILTAPVTGTEYARFAGATSDFRVNTIRNISGTSFLLAANTTDGADNATFSVGGGGAALTSRGAVATLAGNEHADAGKLVLLAGTSGGLCVIGTAGNAATQFYANNAVAMTLNAGGTFNIAGLTASRGVYTDGSKNLVSTIARTAWTVGDVTGSGAMTVTETVYEADYWYAGPYIFIRIALTATLAGTASTTIKIPHPVAGVADDASSEWACNVWNSSAADSSPGYANYDGTHINVKRNNGLNWTVGGQTAKVFLQMFYRAT
jgi:hypothetical protein